MSQVTQKRREQILAELLSKKRVAVRELAEEMAVSEATVRRDLKALADARELTIIHGGAELPRQADFSFQAKHGRNVDAKRTVGRLAAALVDDGDQVFIDSGTTCFEMAAHVALKQSLLAIVNSARLAIELGRPGVRVLMLGGQYRVEQMDTIGAIAHGTLDQLRGYQAFIGADGLSMDLGLSASDVESAALYRRAVSNARETIVVVDHSKFDSTSLFQIVGWERVSRLVTDRPPAPNWRDFLDRRGIELITPESVNPEPAE